MNDRKLETKLNLLHKLYGYGKVTLTHDEQKLVQEYKITPQVGELKGGGVEEDRKLQLLAEIRDELLKE